LPAVHSFLRAWKKGDRATLAAVIGDWEVVRPYCARSDSRRHAEVERKEQASRQRWLALLHYEAGRGHTDDLLYALAAAGDKHLAIYLREALQTPGLADAALDIIGDEVQSYLHA